MIATLDGMGSTGTVRFWHRDEGFGVNDSPDTPGGCWAHFSHLWNDALRYKVDEHPQPDAIRGYFGPGQEDHV